MRRSMKPKRIYQSYREFYMGPMLNNFVTKMNDRQRHISAQFMGNTGGGRGSKEQIRMRGTNLTPKSKQKLSTEILTQSIK